MRIANTQPRCINSASKLSTAAPNKPAEAEDKATATDEQKGEDKNIAARYEPVSLELGLDYLRSKGIGNSYYREI